MSATVEEVTQAIFGQESSSGKADTSAVNYAGATGPMQVTGPTFDALKNKGLIPKNYEHTNPEHSKEAGNRLVSYLYDKYGGVPQKVFAAYYGGEKAVREDGTIRNYRDLKNPKAPTVNQYVDQVMARMGVQSSTEAPQTPAAQATERASVLDSWHEAMPDRANFQKPAKELTDRSAAPIQASAPLTGAGVQPLSVALDNVEAVERATETERQSSDFIDKARASFTANTFVGALIRNRSLAQFAQQFDPTPGFQVDPKKLAGYTADEQDFVMEATGPEHLARIQWEIEDRRADLKTVNASGTGVGIAASLFAGLPEGYLTGMGAMRSLQLARVGSLELAAAGRTGAALASSAVENVGANLALTALQDKFDPYVGAADYGMAVAGGMLGMGLNAPSIFGTASKGELKRSADRMALASAERTNSLREQAVRNIGADASDVQLQAEVKRLEANGIRREVAEASSEVPVNRTLDTDVDTIAEGIVQKLLKKQQDLDNAAGIKRFDERVSAEQRAALAKTEPVTEDVTKVREETARMPDSTPVALKNGSMIEQGMQVPQRRVTKDGQPGEVVDYPAQSARTIMKEVAELDGLDPLVKAVAARLHEQLRDDVAIYAIPKAALVKRMAQYNQPNGRAHYDPNTHSIYVDKAASPAVMTHEVSHALTSLKLAYGRANPNTVHGGLVKQVEALFEEAKKHAGPKGMSDSYFFNNTDEFVASVYSGKSAFTDFLAGIKLPSENILSRLVDVVRKLLGMGETETNALLKLVGLGDELAATPLNVTYKVAGADQTGMFSVRAAPPDILTDPLAQKTGIHLLPMSTTLEQAEAQAILDMYRKAGDTNYKVDETRLSKLMETSVFQGGQSTANTMLRSQNPVVRMAAAELVESPSGAAGRRKTAAIGKWMKEQQFLGNTLNEVQDLYKQYRNAQGGNVVGDFFGGTHWEQFNRLVAEEMESRIPGRAAVDSPPAVRAAADSLELAYERMRASQVSTKTTGWASLPESSRGYMPHKASPEKIRNMTNKQAEAFHQALTDQFVQIEGFDLTFSDKLASKYLDRVRRRALGGFESPVGIHQVGAADVVEDALESMGMTQPEVRAMMGRYMAGGPGHTKRRLKLDLGAEHTIEDGATFKLMDLFETDQFRLLRAQAQRVSGEVALAEHGVMGKAGLKLLRRAMEFGADGEKAQPKEIEAFDQIAAEFLGDPFGTQSKMVDRVLQVNSLSRLGGMGFTQFAEAINGIWHVGAFKSLDAVTSLGRLRSEIKALARGEKVDNPIIGSLEDLGGAQFGTEAYKTVFPFDNQSLEYHTYGKETINAGDRLLRGGAFVQGKLSLWRSIHSTQQRGFAEQIVRKAAQFIKDGTSDAALRDMGISDELIGKLRGDIDSIAQFDGGRLTNFDITKATDVKAAEEFTQAIHRGVSQIIQGTFIGERGKWAHDGLMRLMTQFRTFSLTSVEKQWARQRGNVGTAKLTGMLLGSLSLAAPIYMARTYLNSIGREDQEEYLEKYLTPAQISRASLNYIAMSGLAGDFLDAASAVSGVGKVTGGRSAAESEFVGNMVAPSLGLVDDVWKGLQNTKEGTDPHELVKALPFSRLPWMIPAINGLD